MEEPLLFYKVKQCFGMYGPAPSEAITEDHPLFESILNTPFRTGILYIRNQVFQTHIVGEYAVLQQDSDMGGPNERIRKSEWRSGMESRGYILPSSELDNLFGRYSQFTLRDVIGDLLFWLEFTAEEGLNLKARTLGQLLGKKTNRKLLV